MKYKYKYESYCKRSYCLKMNKCFFTDIDISDLKDISPHKKDTDPAQIMSNT